MRRHHFYQSALQAQILNACSLETASIDNCVEISVQIFKKDKNYLSEKTIQRFFGLLHSDSPPFPFVLDSLARFAGHNNWDEFKKTGYGKKVSGICVTSGSVPHESPSSPPEQYRK